MLLLQTATSLAILGGLLYSDATLANPLQRRADSSSITPAPGTASASSSDSATSGQPSEWVSLSSGTPVSTFTPVVTSVNGKLTTKNAEPNQPTQSTSLSTGPIPTQTGAPPPGHDTPVCQFTDGPFPPFCQPTNGSDAWVGETYVVTWDARHFPANSSVIVQLDYVDPNGGGPQAWSTSETDNSWGVVSVTMDDAWRNDLQRNNLTFSILNLATKGAGVATHREGPTVSLIKKPAQHLPASPPTSNPVNRGLAIGLPVALGTMILIICGLFFGMRRSRQIGLGNIMGRRKGYGERQSRRQRMRGTGIFPGRGRGGGKDGQIRLGEDEIRPSGRRSSVNSTGGGFRDEPTRGVELSSPRGAHAPRDEFGRTRPSHSREESLGSLVESPTEPRFAARSGAPRRRSDADDFRL